MSSNPPAPVLTRTRRPPAPNGPAAAGAPAATAVVAPPAGAGVAPPPPASRAERAGRRRVVVLGYLPPRGTEPVVAGPALRVRQHLVGLTDLLEPVFGGRILVDVRVVLAGPRSVGAVGLLLAGGARPPPPPLGSTPRGPPLPP